MARTDPGLAAVVDRSGDPAMVAWAHDGVGELAGLANVDVAVAAAVALRNVAALQAAAERGPKVTRKAAAAGLHRLRSAGVSIPSAPAEARAFTLEKEHVEVMMRAYVGVPDDNGDLEVMLTIANEQGSCVVGVVLGGRSSLRDVQISFVNRSGIREVWKAAEKYRRAEVPFVAALHYAERFASHHEDWRHFVRLLPEGLIASARLLDPVGRRLEGQPAEPASLVRWMPNPDLLEEKPLSQALMPLMEAVASPLYPDDESRRAAMDAIMNGAADAALTDTARLALAKYLELTREFLWLAGWDRHHAMFGEILAEVASGAKGSEIGSVSACVKLFLAQSVMSAMNGEEGEAQE